VTESHHESAAPSIGWLELFYDLVFVAAVIVLSNSMSHHPTVENAILTGGSFALIWWVWLATTMLLNRLPADDTPQRALMLLQMLLITLITIAAGNSTEAHADVEAVLYGVLLIVTACMYQRLVARGGELHRYAVGRRNGLLVAAVCFLLTWPVPEIWTELLWAVAVVAIVAPAFGLGFAGGIAAMPLNERHILERMGAFTILVLGETFVKVGLTAANGSLDQLDWVIVALQFLIFFSVWWAYFDDIPRAGFPRRTWSARLWLVGHLPLHLAIVALAVGAGKLLLLKHDETPEPLDMVMFAGPLVILYLALALVGMVSQRYPVGPLLALRLLTALAVAVLGMAGVWGSLAVEPALVLFGVVVLAHAYVASRLGQHTEVRPGAAQAEGVHA
jgi:low temperature requirement protein LtrA